MNKNEISARLCNEIKLSGMTTVEIAKKIGITQSMVTQYKTTQKLPSLETFALLCKILDCSADEILGL